ncbi:MAG: thioesterase family protein [Ignavibacteriota bacterium]|jgi:YbgC/YbaW family acyl-CoA thioester hydrolase|nr:MAG: thioesterase [Chlorobiota bacterium]MBE7475238.1 thioesterase family protein [Ignavibacteriales bacterium]MBL1122204.1 thioesterase [Ignavibacteriota bacterium]MCE7857649.1 thioesterase [Ignavibacteria bacterium CHB3]GJQ40517.1 MAG: thioesterase [Ignavibacteriaceae bacterium]
MPRIKIELPQKFIFKTELALRITDINYGGHLGNDSLLSIIHEARVRFLNHLGYSESNLEGNGIIMIDAAIQYKSEGFYGDSLIIEIDVNSFSGIGCDFVYRITNKSNGKVIALAKTGIVFFNYEKRKTVSVPSEFALKIESLT